MRPVRASTTAILMFLAMSCSVQSVFGQQEEGTECELSPEEVTAGARGVLIETSKCSTYTEFARQNGFCRRVYEGDPFVKRRRPTRKCYVCCRPSAIKCQQYRKQFASVLDGTCGDCSSSYCCRQRGDEETSNCATHVQPLIHGGEVAAFGEFPHAVSLGVDYNGGTIVSFSCGGSLISEKWVLTAAHCFVEKRMTIVRMGHQRQYVYNPADPDLDYFIDQDELKFHPDYLARQRTPYSDVALVKILGQGRNTAGLTFTANVFPACLSQMDPELLAGNGTKPTAIGWGNTEHYGQRSIFLLKADIPILSKGHCDRLIQRYRPLRSKYKEGSGNGILCGYSVQRKDACQGDSGGSYSLDVTGVCGHEIVGLVASGVSCGGKLPGMYTDVRHHLAWIENIVWPVTDVVAELARNRDSPSSAATAGMPSLGTSKVVNNQVNFGAAGGKVTSSNAIKFGENDPKRNVWWNGGKRR